MIVDFREDTPQIGSNVFVAPDAWVIGDVELGDNVSVFFGAVLRGDILPIRIGARSNIQEHSMLHTSFGRVPTIVGREVTIGHRAILHGCSVGDRCLIGMGAVVLDEAVLEEECMVAAGAVVTEGKRFPRRSLIMGVPGKVVRTLSDEDLKPIALGVKRYLKTGAELRKLLG